MIHQGKIDQENGKDLNKAMNELNRIKTFGHKSKKYQETEEI